MRAARHADYLALLQPLARCSVRQAPQEIWDKEYWPRVCQLAGLAEHADYEDLTWDELQQLHGYLVDQQLRLLEKWTIEIGKSHI